MQRHGRCRCKRMCNCPLLWTVRLLPSILAFQCLIHAAVSSFNGIQHPFLVAHDHLSHLKSLSDTQSKALQIAYANLSQHLQPLVDEFQSFASRVEASFKTEEELIKSSKLDMALLPKLVINPALLKKKDDEGKIRTMGDYVNAKKMEQVRESCRILHGEIFVISTA